MQQGGDRKLLGEGASTGKEPSGEKKLSYGEAFLQSYEKCEHICTSRGDTARLFYQYATSMSHMACQLQPLSFMRMCISVFV